MAMATLVHSYAKVPSPAPPDERVLRHDSEPAPLHSALAWAPPLLPRARLTTTASMPSSPPPLDVRCRFAPSPTGTLHVGGARTALFNWLKARNEGGKFVIRIEDTDTARSTRESEDSMVKDLRWLGLDWDEGPDVGGDYGPYRQSERGEIYQAKAKQLMDAGHAYPCFCTQEELDKKKEAAEARGEVGWGWGWGSGSGWVGWRNGCRHHRFPSPYTRLRLATCRSPLAAHHPPQSSQNPKYDGMWRDADPELVKQKIDAGETYTIRFKVPPGARVEIDDIVRGKVGWDAEATVGDFIILRSSGIPVYNFCVAVDDATMKISHVIRAEEHLTNTLRQVRRKGVKRSGLGWVLRRACLRDALLPCACRQCSVCSNLHCFCHAMQCLLFLDSGAWCRPQRLSDKPLLCVVDCAVPASLSPPSSPLSLSRSLLSRCYLLRGAAVEWVSDRVIE